MKCLVVRVDEAARMLGMTRNAFETAVRENRLPQPLACGRPRRWNIAQLEAIKAAPPAPKPRMPRSIQHRPGASHLYRHFAADGTLLYVGISLSTIGRLSEHAQCSHWFWQIARVEITAYASREAAAKAELIAIQHEHPVYNVTGKKRGFRHGVSTDNPYREKWRDEVDSIMARHRQEVAERQAA